MKTILLIGAVAGTTILIVMGSKKRLQHKKDFLHSIGFETSLIERMSVQEIEDCYTFTSKMLNNQPITDTALMERIMIIGAKYNIFT